MKHNPNIRIGIVGAGCAGLTAAEELRDRGYKNITLIEAKNRVGGKTYTVDHKYGGHYEGGTVWLIHSAYYQKYMQRYGVTDTRPTPRVRIIDLNTGRVSSPFLISSRTSWPKRLVQLARFLLEVRRHGHPDDLGFRHPRYGAMATATGDWYKRHDLEFAREAFGPIATGAQMGPLYDTISIAYTFKFFAVLNRYSLFKQLVLNLPQFRQGNSAIWQSIAETHQIVSGSPVCRVERGATVHVQTERESFEFDHLIWAAPTDPFLKVADADDEERAVFERAHTINRAVLTYKLEGIPDDSFYMVKNIIDGTLPASYPTLFFEVEPGSKIYNFYPYMDENTTLETMEQSVYDLVKRVGGRVVERVHDPIYWTWFPHFALGDIVGGIFERLEALQGRRNTYFANELAAGVSVTYGMEYAAGLVNQFF